MISTNQKKLKLRKRRRQESEEMKQLFDIDKMLFDIDMERFPYNYRLYHPVVRV